MPAPVFFTVSHRPPTLLSHPAIPSTHSTHLEPWCFDFLAFRCFDVLGFWRFDHSCRPLRERRSHTAVSFLLVVIIVIVGLRLPGVALLLLADLALHVTEHLLLHWL